MPTIRVEHDVFEGLKSLAEPFTDTPNTVIRRLLQERGVISQAPVLPPASRSQPQQAPVTTKEAAHARGAGLTPQSVYETFLLHALSTQFKGEADKIDATRSVISLMKQHGFIGPADEVRVKTGETKAENTIAWGRNALKERGLISRNSRRGTWELTPKGLVESRNVTLPLNK